MNSDCLKHSIEIEFRPENFVFCLFIQSIRKYFGTESYGTDKISYFADFVYGKHNLIFDSIICRDRDRRKPKPVRITNLLDRPLFTQAHKLNVFWPCHSNRHAMFEAPLAIYVLLLQMIH